MQHQKLLNPTQPDSLGSYPQDFHSYLEGDLFSEDSQTKFPAGQTNTHQVYTQPSKRELFRIRLFLRIERDKLPNQEHVIRYMRHKFRVNCKPNTIRSAYCSIFLFFKFLESINKTRLDRLSRSDLEAFLEHEQNRGLNPSTLNTRLWALYTFCRY